MDLLKPPNGIRCFISFDYGWFDKMYDRIKYLIGKKSGITDSINHSFEKAEFIHIILYLLKKFWLFLML